MKYNYDSNNNTYLTPPEVYNPILEKEGLTEFDTDVCCSKKNIPAKQHFINGKADGLKKRWKKKNWMNPPFTTCEDWIRKAYSEQQKGKTTYSILPVRTETLYWKECILENPNAEIKFLTKNKKEGVTFIDPTTGDYVKDKNGKKGLFKNPLAIVIFRGIEK